MMWTKDQQRAIELDGCDMLLSAAAGSGKTAVLTERIVRLVRAGADIDRFLVVTFTESATAEMKRRIAARLLSAANEEEGDAAARLRAQALLTGRANISTLHAFCLYILRRNFHILELDPSFRPADELLGGTLFEAALEEAAELRYEAGDEEFLALVGALGGREEALFTLARRLYDFLMAQPAPFEWLLEAVNAYQLTDIAAHPALGALLEDFQFQTAEAVQALLRAREITPPEFAATLALLDDDLSKLRAFALCRDLPAYQEALQSLQFNMFTWPRKTLPEQKERVKAIRDGVKNTILKQRLALKVPLAQEPARMAAMHVFLKTLYAYIEDVHSIYGAKKRARAVIDFADMEHLALRALQNEEIAAALQSRFQYVFVDEYQDSSHIQECLIERVKRKNALFLVGDVKQSIYRFRQADPALFLGRMRRYERAPQEAGALVRLNANFRSSAPVIRAVNGVFSRIMSAQTGELDYDERAALHLPGPAREEDDPLSGVEMHILNRTASPEEAEGAEAAPAAEEDDFETADHVRAEAELAAARILALKETAQYRDPKTGVLRKLRYADFAILLRAQRHAAKIWAETLSGMGIPCYAQLTGGYFDAVEVQVFLNLLRVIDNRRQDIPLLSVLRSPIFGFTLEELVLLKTDYPGESLFDRLRACAEEAAAPLSEKAGQVLQSLADWRRDMLLLPLEAFLASLMDATGYYDYMGALPAGRERQANLNALLDRARDYLGAGGAGDIWSFLCFMDGAASTARLGNAQAGAADVARILSMHASKGLEYPVVILGGLGGVFNRLDLRENILLERTLGMGARLILDGTKQDTLLRKAIARKLWRQQLAEEMRILYVGMTRARSRLLMIGSLKEAGKKAREAAEVDITPGYCARALSFLDWLLPVAVQNDFFPLSIHQPGALPLPKEAAVVDVPALKEKTHESLLDALREQFNWRYPHAGAADIPSKRSVSSLSGQKEISLSDAPPILTSSLTAAQRGTALHQALSLMRLEPEGADKYAFVVHELARLRELGMLSSLQAQAVNPAQIAWFLSTPLGARLVNSPRVERELAFSLELPARSLIEADSDEPVLLQGVVDCCFLEGDGWILLDYKTDRAFFSVSPEQAAAEHALQLSYYAEALHALTGIPTKEKHVVLLSYREVVEIL